MPSQAFEGPLRFPSFFADIGIEGVVSIVFTLIFIWWTIYTVVAIYHWIRFGRISWLAVPAVALHLAVSGAIFVHMTSGLH